MKLSKNFKKPHIYKEVAECYSLYSNLYGGAQYRPHLFLIHFISESFQ